jgi:hypothetical protein
MAQIHTEFFLFPVDLNWGARLDSKHMMYLEPVYTSATLNYNDIWEVSQSEKYPAQAF